MPAPDATSSSVRPRRRRTSRKRPPSPSRLRSGSVAVLSQSASAPGRASAFDTQGKLTTLTGTVQSDRSMPVNTAAETRSQALFELGQQYLPGGVTGPGRRADPAIGHPFYVQRGQGSRVWDA